MGENILGAHTQHLADGSGGGQLVVGDDGVVGADFQLKLAEARTRPIPDPLYLLRRGRCEPGVHAIGSQHSRPVVEIEADDVGFPAGEAEDFFTAAADHQRRVGALGGRRNARETGPVDEVSFDGQRLSCHKRLVGVHELRAAGEALGKLVEGQSDGVVLRLDPAGADAELQPTL